MTTPEYRQANRAKIAAAARLYRKRYRAQIRARRLARFTAQPGLRVALSRKREARRKRSGVSRAAYFKEYRARLAEEIKWKRYIRRLRDRPKTKAYQSQPHVKLGLRLRQRLSMVLGRRSEKGRLLRLLGCSTADLVAHLERQFKSGMTWENRGRVWHVDHILPLSSFNLADDAELARACHFSNLRPLFAFDNLSKGAKVPRGTSEAKAKLASRLELLS